MSDETITYEKRDSVYVEGELAFKEGKRRSCNPYASSSPTLEQIWWNGWDHSRRRKRSEKVAPEDDNLTREPYNRL